METPELKDNEAENGPVLMSFSEHLDDLRRYLIRIIIAIASAFILVFINKRFLFETVIFAPKQAGFFTNDLLCRLSENLNMPVLCINHSALELINIQLAGQFTAHIMVSLITALIIVFPFILWQIWLFVKPGLFAPEVKKLKVFVSFSSFLFFLGVLFAYFIIIPLLLNFLGNYKVAAQVSNTISLMSYISTVSLVTLAMGVVFQLPVLVFFLTRVGILTPELMQRNRKIVFIALLILSAIITPPDVISQLLVVFPLYILFEISIIISKKYATDNR